MKHDLQKINKHTAAVILETIQGGAGFIVPENDYLRKVRNRCNEVGALMILDEIQCGIGRTGTFFGFQQYHIVPDIVITGKGLGGGMPIGAFISSKSNMDLLHEQSQTRPYHHLWRTSCNCGCGLSNLTHTFSIPTLMEQTSEKEALIRELLIHEDIRGDPRKRPYACPDHEESGNCKSSCS